MKRFLFPIRPQPSRLGPLGACAYLAGFALPFEWDIPLALLALSGSLALATCGRNGPAARWPLALPVLVFSLVGGLSILLSEDIGRSARLSAAWLPAALLFFLIAGYFRDLRHTRRLYLTFSLVGLGLASVLLWTAGQNGWAVSRHWASQVGSPIFIVTNDSAFLAVIAPLSLALFYRAPRSVEGVLAALSILLSIGAVCMLRSRVAMLTVMVSLTCAAVLMRPRRGFIWGVGILSLALLVDGLLGFPLAAKFRHVWDGESGRLRDGRLWVWSAAWAMFREAPWWGHGPHTFTYTTVDGITMTWVHNLYLEALAEQGLVGLAALGFLLVSGVSAGWNVQRAALGEARILGAGALAGLIGFGCAALFELSFLRQWVVIILFALLGVVAQLAATKQR